MKNLLFAILAIASVIAFDYMMEADRAVLCNNDSNRLGECSQIRYGLGDSE